MSIDKEKLKALATAGLQKDCGLQVHYDFIRALDPKTVLELLAEIEELQKAVELHAGYHAKADEFDRIQAENEALRQGMRGDYDLDAWLAFVEEAPQLRKDAGRYRLLRDMRYGPALAVWREGRYPLVGKYCDDAVDAAMAKEVKP